ncbi:MAG: polysaccharide deacetylase family protein [Lachnospiraceae bacterium]|nr:polysaccharide deacetylase family protein [Lachnospiraceae bacterium]
MVIKSKLLIMINMFFIYLSRIYTKTIRKMDTNSYIAMFHDIVEDEKQQDEYSVTRKEFANYIASLVHSGWNFSGSPPTVRKKSIQLTFDDGFSSVYHTAYPILKKHGIPFTVFITVDYIGTDGYMTWENITELCNSGLCRIGSHTLSHPLFRFLTLRQKTEELCRSKERIEKFIHTEVTDFAFPYGSFYAVDYKSRKLAKKYYQNVYTTTGICLHSNQSCYPRINVPFYRKKHLK